MYQKTTKKLLDLTVAVITQIILLPLFLLIAIAIKIDSKGPVLFKQKRVGKNKKYFTIYKFRTMKSDTPKDTPTHLLKDPESYITRMGRFLRKTSLDEIPQLFNILKGEMSFIGPRPALWNQYDLIKERDKYNANVLVPGISGWAQVNGRDELPIDIKAKFDGEYAKRISFLFDLKCIIKTFSGIISQKGYEEGQRK